MLGARAFALASLSTTEEKDFISLSVSAHKWMNVIEVYGLLSLGFSGYILTQSL